MAVKFWRVSVEIAALRTVSLVPYTVDMDETDVEKSCIKLRDQFDVLLVYMATLETGVEKSCKRPRLY